MYYTNKLKGKPLQMMGYKVTGSKRCKPQDTIEVRRVDNAGRGQQEQNGGNFVVEIDTETEEYCLVFKSTDAIMQLEVNDADYDVKMPEDFPFEETYNKAIERYGVKGPWD